MRLHRFLIHILQRTHILIHNVFQRIAETHQLLNGDFVVCQQRCVFFCRTMPCFPSALGRFGPFFVPLRQYYLFKACQTLPQILDFIPPLGYFLIRQLLQIDLHESLLNQRICFFLLFRCILSFSPLLVISLFLVISFLLLVCLFLQGVLGIQYFFKELFPESSLYLAFVEDNILGQPEHGREDEQCYYFACVHGLTGGIVGETELGSGVGAEQTESLRTLFSVLYWECSVKYFSAG